jgi:hypothetical protein
MMTALIVFLGLSSCATLFILSALFLGARGSHSDSYSQDAVENGRESAQTPSIVPAFSH